MICFGLDGFFFFIIIFCLIISNERQGGWTMFIVFFFFLFCLLWHFLGLYSNLGNVTDRCVYQRKSRLQILLFRYIFFFFFCFSLWKAFKLFLVCVSGHLQGNDSISIHTALNEYHPQYLYPIDTITEWNIRWNGLDDGVRFASFYGLPKNLVLLLGYDYHFRHSLLRTLENVCNCVGLHEVISEKFYLIRY